MNIVYRMLSMYVVDGDARVSRGRSFSQIKDFKDLDCHLLVPILPG